MRTAPTQDVIRRLNPLIKGWSTYYRGVASTETFTSLDHDVHYRMYRWAKRRHNRKSGAWIRDQYFGRYNPEREDRWVFADRTPGRSPDGFAWSHTQPP